MFGITLAWAIAGTVFSFAILAISYSSFEGDRRLRMSWIECLLAIAAIFVLTLPISLLGIYNINKQIVDTEVPQIKWDEHTKSHLVYYRDENDTISTFSFEKKFERAYRDDVLHIIKERRTIWFFDYGVFVKYEFVEPEIL